MNIKPVLFLLYLFIVSSIGFAQHSKIIKTPEVELHYQLFGNGIPVLIINGGPGFSSEGFLPVAKKFEELGCQSILFDQRGTGKSVLPFLNQSALSMDLMCKDIEAIRKDMGIEKWIVFGHSFGGMLANYYATKHPNQILAMIQSSSGGVDLRLLENAQSNLYSKLTEAEVDSLNYWQGRYRETNSNTDRLKYNQFMAKAYVYDKRNEPIIAERLMQGDLNVNGMVWSNLIAMGFDCKEGLSTFNKPTLIIQGKNDIIDERLAIRADSVIQNSKLVLLDQCGHYGWLDREEKYWAAINSFLKEKVVKQVK